MPARGYEFYLRVVNSNERSETNYTIESALNGFYSPVAKP